MAGHECYHCKQWVEEGEAHDCWTTTEAALTADLAEELREAWERLRESAVEFGEQRIYASHSSIMFSRRSCYFFVRPKRKYLEVCIFLGRALNAPHVHRVMPSSRSKFANMLRIVHRDEVEAPITDWLREAYEFVESEAASARKGKAAGTNDSRQSSVASPKSKLASLKSRVASQKSRVASPKSEVVPSRKSDSRPGARTAVLARRRR